MRPMSTSSFGWARRSFMSGRRLWPPAMTFASGSSSIPTASCRLPGAAYANLAGNIASLLVRRGRLGLHDVGLLEGLFAAQLPPGRERRLHDVLVTSAAAEVPVQPAPNLGLGRCRVVAQQLVD